MKLDPIGVLAFLVFGVPAILALGYIAYLLVSVLFLGGSSACPQNMC